MKISNIMSVLIALIVVGCATTNHLSQGMLYVNQKDYANAINEFKAEIAVQPSVQAYANLGAAYMAQGKTNLAMDALKRGEGLDDRDTTLTYNMTALYSVTDKTDIALIYLDKTLSNGFKNYDAIRFDPDLSNLRGEPEFRQILEKHKIFLQ